MAKIIKNCKRKSKPDYISEDVIWKIISQITYALNECHTREGGKILHRDLKPGNVFLDKNNNIKIGDFGLSKVMGAESVYAQTRVGTPYYMSPEQINGKRYDEKSDIWSLGCVIFEIAALRPPFTAENQLALAKKIRDGKIPDLPKQYSDDLSMIVKSMITNDPSKRPSVKDILSFKMVYQKLQEKKIKDAMNHIKSKHSGSLIPPFLGREKAVSRKEDDLKKREAACDSKEAMLKEWEQRLSLKEKNINDDSNTTLTFQKPDQFMTYRSTDCNNIEELKFDRYGIAHKGSNGSSDPDSTTRESM